MSEPTARESLEELLHGYRPETVKKHLDGMNADAYRLAADALEAGCAPDRGPEYREGVDWAVATLRSAADKIAAGARR
ncbi:hypothetical protein ABTY61_22740 [Kitasatospora sp. NPDC096128]|uniref:hypothetical protein n=1 Tax=Kitasatospora sp. NPDC096128 TaxID=3155547 RepID=UPI00332BF043